MKNIQINPKYKEYLPSKGFTKFLSYGLLVALLIIVIATIFQRKDSFALFNRENKTNNQGESISDLLQSDTDLDGVLDWEEALWGTDKTLKATFDGVPDGVYIKQKKDALATEGGDGQTLNETEQFAREFFASYVALKSSGEDTESINNFSRALGERIGDPNLSDKYSSGEIKTTVETGREVTLGYYTDMQNVFDKYRASGMGEEIDIVNTGLLTYTSTGKKVDYAKLNIIGKAYQDFATEMMRVEVPVKFEANHLRMANMAHNIGRSVLSMEEIMDDPIVGLTGITQYQKYSNEFIEISEDLEQQLVRELE